MGTKRIGIDRLEGIAPGLGLLQQYIYVRPIAGAVTSVHAAVSLTGATETTVSTAITNPDVYRPLSSTIVDANATLFAGGAVVHVDIVGKTPWGSPQKERITHSAAGTVNGSKPFYTVDSYKVTSAIAGGASDTHSLGLYATKVGVPYKLRDVNDIKKFRRGVIDSTGGASDAAFAAETVAAYDKVNGVITLTNNLDGAGTYIIEVRSEDGWVVGGEG